MWFWTNGQEYHVFLLIYTKLLCWTPSLPIFVRTEFMNDIQMHLIKCTFKVSILKQVPSAPHQSWNMIRQIKYWFTWKYFGFRTVNSPTMHSPIIRQVCVCVFRKHCKCSKRTFPKARVTSKQSSWLASVWFGYHQFLRSFHFFNFFEVNHIKLVGTC